MNKIFVIFYSIQFDYSKHGHLFDCYEYHDRITSNNLIRLNDIH